MCAFVRIHLLTDNYVGVVEVQYRSCVSHFAFLLNCTCSDFVEAARASRPLKKSTVVHEHVFEKGAEVCVDAEEGAWKKECTECGFTVLFEKL